MMEGIIMEKTKQKVQLTELQSKLVTEMKNQGADRQTVNGIMARLKTVEQQKEMLKYLISIKEKEVSKSKVILQSMKIVEKTSEN